MQLTSNLVVCSSDDETYNNTDGNTGREEVVIDEDFGVNYQIIDINNAVKITINSDNTVSIENPYESDGVTITENTNNIYLFRNRILKMVVRNILTTIRF